MDETRPTRDNSARSTAIDPRVCIGHVNLRVSDVERSLSFYTEVLGFELTARLGTDAAFISAGGYHHHIGLNCWESRRGARPAAGATGLHHFAILYPDRATFAAAYRRVVACGVTITGASDHGCAEAVYIEDPDGNGVELTWDRPRDRWPSGPVSLPLDLEELASA
ncbi:MAG: VOC family protein [Rhizobiaceae bacterium]|nr:VOC family protein [Rhizobiaceae bacterium]